MKRRDFLMTSVAACAAPKVGFASRSAVDLRAAETNQQILPTKYAGETKVYSFNGSVPGPELRVVQGEPLDVRLHNDLREGAAVHWHGVRLQNAMDGVPMLTQDLVQPGQGFDYQFVPKDAGTYWYHSHFTSQQQVARGLMGALVVEERIPPDVDHDIVAVLTDWRLDPEGQLTDDFDNLHDISHAGRMGNFAKAFLPDVQLRQGERIRLRLINAAVDRIFPIVIKGLEGKVVALDGMPLSQTRGVGRPILAPAQRMDIIADVTGPVGFEMEHRAGAYPLGELAVSGSVEPRITPIAPLEANEMPVPGEVGQDLTLTMLGGAMGGHHDGGGIWSFNHVSGMQPDPFARFKMGETAKIKLVNDTRFPHGIHLHGHHFHEINADGSLGDLRDTSLVDPGETKEIVCVFDNPGKWMLHCHMLSHQAGGMKTWVEVS